MNEMNKLKAEMFGEFLGNAIFFGIAIWLMYPYIKDGSIYTIDNLKLFLAVGMMFVVFLRIKFMRKVLLKGVKYHYDDL